MRLLVSEFKGSSSPNICHSGDFAVVLNMVGKTSQSCIIATALFFCGG